MKTKLSRLAVAFGLLASLAFAGPVQAAERGTNVLDVFGTMGIWGTRTNFFADWDVTKAYNGSTLEWRFSHVGMNALVQNGKACDANICEDWTFSGNFKFYNAAGVQVGPTFTPPNGNCHAAAYSPSSRYFGRCRTTTIWMPTSATKVKFTWTVSLRRTQDGLWLNPWSATKTVTLS